MEGDGSEPKEERFEDERTKKRWKAEGSVRRMELTCTALELCELEDEEGVLSTGWSELDTLLEGGLRPCQHLELAGMPATGKTQVCLCLAATSARDGCHVVYVDTQNAFHVRRALELAQWRGEEEDKLANVRLVRVHDLFEAFQVVDALMVHYAMLDAVEGRRKRILIVDSLSSLISPHLGAGAGLGYALMIALAHALQKLAHAHRVAILTTNHLVRHEGNNLSNAVPALGEGWVYQPQTRIMLTREERENFSQTVLVKARVSHSCSLPTDREAIFQLGE